MPNFTYNAIKASFIKLLNERPLSQIKVKDIVADCGVNRKTFYYHFEDIYALLRWIFEEEAVNIIKKFYLLNDYDEAMEFIYEYISENKDLLRNAYDAFGSVELSSFFHMSFVGLNESLIESVEQKMHKRLPERTREYLCEFLTEASGGLLLNIISGNMHFDRSKDMMPVSSIIRASIVGVLTEQGI